MKIEHRYRSYNHHGKITSYNWTFTFEYNGVTYTGDIEYHVGWNGDSDGHFMGYLRNPYIQRTYKNTYIVFGYSDVRNNVKYILKAMKEVINGDFSNVRDVGNYACDISNLKANTQIMCESNRFYKISEKDFIKDEYDELICEYNGYRIEISYDDEYQYWCADAFDLKAEQYVFYPCLIVPDKDKTQLNNAIQQVAKYIEEKIKSNCEEDDILIYI